MYLREINNEHKQGKGQREGKKQTPVSIELTGLDLTTLRL